ncbi:lysophospholipid acyltransferase family protein [Gilvimarinus sp. F26214L]|uniref:lysophospholipid acyltransferase family protein n=1 Tax=Gilvimarinus sp. DZF01 TaxID=3461371 RepID=UPI00404531B2
MLLLRSVLFYLGYGFTGILFGTLSLVLWLLPVKSRFHVVLVWNRFVIWWLRITCGIRLNLIDHNRGRINGPHVILSKHQTIWETVFLQYYFQPLCTILKRSLLFLPFFGWGLATLKPIAIDRSSPMQALRQVKREGAKRIRDGFNLLVFPEGTRTAPGKVGHYARSGVDVAATAGVSVIPVAHNAGECWPAKTFLKYPGTITVVIGEPIATGGRDSRAVIAEVKEWIEGQMAEMAPGRRQGS